MLHVFKVLQLVTDNCESFPSKPLTINFGVNIEDLLQHLRMGGLVEERGIFLKLLSSHSGHNDLSSTLDYVLRFTLPSSSHFKT